MIQMQSVLEVADNSGAKSILTMSVLGQARTIAGVGDIITGAVQEALPGRFGEEGAGGEGGRRPHCGEDSPSGRFVFLKFDKNAAVLIDKDKNPVGTRIFGPVARELREKDFMKIISLAPEVL